MKTVLWQDPSDVGAERCRLADSSLAGTALVAVEGAPCETRYLVRFDSWRTRRVEMERSGPEDDARVVLDVDDGRWRVDGQHRADLAGCLDVDLEFSPATNTLPIRRLDLPVGTGADIEVAWVRFPSLRVERAAQRYTRLGPDRYEFRTGDFVAELFLDEHGLVRRYADLWRQVAASQTP